MTCLGDCGDSSGDWHHILTFFILNFCCLFLLLLRLANGAGSCLYVFLFSFFLLLQGLCYTELAGRGM